jgi:hypothetical protein
MTGSKPVSPYLKGGVGVPAVNNKRTRCDDENGSSVGLKNGPAVAREPEAKRPRLNGTAPNHLVTEDSQHGSEDGSLSTANHLPTFDDDSTTLSTLPATPRVGELSEVTETRSARRKNRAKEEIQVSML